MGLMKNKMDFECAANHIPDWIQELSEAIFACMSKEDRTRILALLDEYNELIDKEKSNNEDGFSLFGVELQKEELINEYIKICEKYKEEAIELEKLFKE